MKTYIIYMHKNKINGKMYIGKTCQDPEKRFGSNGSGYRNCKMFYLAIKKYGWNNFEHIVLCSNLSPEEANIKEREYIKEYKSNDTKFGYNIRTGGQGIESEDSLKQWKDPDYVERVRRRNIANWNKPEYRERLMTNMKEAWKDPEKRQRRSDAAKERWANEDFHKKATEAVTKACGRAVICIETGELFETVKAACEKYNLYHGNFNRGIVHGYRMGGFHWKYAD